MFRKRIIGLVVAGWGIAFMSAVVHAEVIYTENFGTGTTVLPSDVGWDAWVGSTASTAIGGVFYVNGQYSDSTGRYLVMTNNTLALAATVEPGDVTTENIQSVSWLANHNDTTSAVRVAVQIGADWYATYETFSMSSAGGSDQWDEKAELHSFVWTNAKSAWRSLAFTPGVELALATETIDSDLSGDVVSFGVLIERTDHVRIDDFTIDAVPEPSIWALLTIVGVCLTVIQRWCR